MRLPRPPHATLMLVVLFAALAFLGTASPAWAEEGAAPAGPAPGRVLAGILLGLVALVGVGCLLGVVRIVFPGPTVRADRAVHALGTGRLFLTGILPALGVALLGAAAGRLGGPVLPAAYAVLILLPAAVLTLLGGAAAVPHLGQGLLGGSRERSLLARAVVGAVALGLAGGAAVLLARQGGGALFGLVVAGWFLGTGLGAVARQPDAQPRADATPPL